MPLFLQSGHDPGVLGLSLELGSLLSGEPPSPSPSAFPQLVLFLSVFLGVMILSVEEPDKST